MGAYNAKSMTRFFILLLLLVVVGCSPEEFADRLKPSRTWTYTPKSRQRNTATGSKVAVVLPFDDDRVEGSHDTLKLIALPLVPYGSVDDSKPEKSDKHVSGRWLNFNPVQDFPKALVQELDASGRYKEAAFASYQFTHADYIFTGRIENTDYHLTETFYGLGIFGPLLYLVLPIGSFQNDLALQLTCTDAHSGATLFEASYAAQPVGQIFFLYTLPNDFSYPAMLQEVYGKFLDDLSKSGKCS